MRMVSGLAAPSSFQPTPQTLIPTSSIPKALNRLLGS